jgi:hypothetical protein
MDFGKRAAFNQIISDMEGRMLNLQVDGHSKTIRLELGPKGEDQPILVEVENYQLEERDGATTITIHKIKSDRPLYNLALQTFVAGKRYDIPSDMAAWVKLFL